MTYFKFIKSNQFHKVSIRLEKKHMCSAVPTTQKASQRYYCGFQHFLPYHLLLHKFIWIAWPSNLCQSFPFLQRTVTAATLTVLCILSRSSRTNRKGLLWTKHDVDCDSEASSPDHWGLLSRSRSNPKDWWQNATEQSPLLASEWNPQTNFVDSTTKA